MSGTPASCLSALLMMGILLSDAPASANFRDGSELLRQCTATIGAEMDFCYGYIDAVTDYLLENNVMGKLTACITRDLDDSRVRDLVVKFLRENPALRHTGAPELIARALSEAFPCQ